ncbi:MAG: hypothetical protein NTY53_06225 [Kiritimatiellaeota bacterium]|nr:hypothetical protein [Kiritimatiellota bacterium]
MRKIIIGACTGALLGTLMAAETPAQSWSPFGIGSCYINNRSEQDNARWDLRRHPSRQRPVEQARQAGHTAGQQPAGLVQLRRASCDALPWPREILGGLERAAEFHRP